MQMQGLLPKPNYCSTAAAPFLAAHRQCRSGGCPCGILHGIPILLKDNIATRDRLNTTADSLPLLGSALSRDAGIVQRLRDAGAVSSRVGEPLRLSVSATPNAVAPLLPRRSENLIGSEKLGDSEPPLPSCPFRPSSTADAATPFGSLLQRRQLLTEMSEKKQKFLTVAPFKCTWNEDLRFREAGRGCISFEAFAQNDVTLVFREQVGSHNYHYKMDNSPNYTVILGSNRNRRLKIEVNGQTVVDIAGVGLCCSSSFQNYWISIYDGLISIGEGRYPFQNIVVQWLDSNPNFSVQYVGLSSWDKHVGYRNIIIFPLTQHHNSLWSQIDCKQYEAENDMEFVILDISNDDHGKWELLNFLESWDFSDVMFIVGAERKIIPSHKVILNAYGDFSANSCGENIINLPSTTYPVLLALLEYIYGGQTKVVESQLGALRDLCVQFHVLPLIKHCDEIFDRFNTTKRLFDSNKKVEILSNSCETQQCGVFPREVPTVIGKLKQFLSSGEHNDVNIYVEGHGLVARSHKLILSTWSAPFSKMFTSGMLESKSPNVTFSDVSSEAFSAMLHFMYCGELEIEKDKISSLIIPLILLADQFAITILQRECCKYLLECISEGWCCPPGRRSSIKT